MDNLNPLIKAKALIKIAKEYQAKCTDKDAIAWWQNIIDSHQKIINDSTKLTEAT